MSHRRLYVRVNGRDITHCHIGDLDETLRVPISLRVFFSPNPRQALVRLRAQLDTFSDPFFLDISPCDITCVSFTPGTLMTMLLHVDKIDLIAPADQRIFVGDPLLKDLRAIARRHLVRICVPSRDGLPNLEGFCGELEAGELQKSAGAGDLKTMYAGRGGQVINQCDHGLSLALALDAEEPVSPPSYTLHGNKGISKSAASATLPKKRLRTRSPSISPPSSSAKDAQPTGVDGRGGRDRYSSPRQDEKRMARLFRKMQVQQHIMQNLSDEIEMKSQTMAKEFAEMMARHQEHEAKIQVLSAAIDKRKEKMTELFDEVKAIQARIPLHDEIHDKYQKRIAHVIHVQHDDDNDEDDDEDDHNSTCSLPSTVSPDSAASDTSKGSLHAAALPPSEVSTVSIVTRTSGIPDEIKEYIDSSVLKLQNNIADFHGSIEELERAVHDMERNWEESAWDKEVWDAIADCPEKSLDLVREKLLYTGLYST